jgi:nitrilase
MPLHERDSVKVAVVQAASVFFDKAASTAKAVALIQETAANGANMILFPESFISGYPRGFTFGTFVGGRTLAGRKDWARHWQSAVSVGDEATQAIAEAARANKVYVFMGITERDDFGNHGTLYNSMLYFGPDGELLGNHRKLKPTASERLLWGEGDGSTLTAVDTPYGKVGGLICWENYMPLARMTMYLKGVHIYLAPTADSRESWQATIRHIACEGRCFVLGCNQYFHRDMYPQDLECYAELQSQPEEMCPGGSAIIDPFGEYAAEPLFGKEGVLYATLDLNQIDYGHYDFDVVGHYNRSDVFQLSVNETPRVPVVFRSDAETEKPLANHEATPKPLDPQ